MPDRTITQRSARYRARARERGLVEVRVRVPKGREGEIRKVAAEMREGTNPEAGLQTKVQTDSGEGG